jgi:anhydro-N-acetylmuramic acid kinase
LSTSELYIGIMSGTSLDGADAVLVDLQHQPRVLGFASTRFPEPLRALLLRLSQPAESDLHTAALAANELARIYAATLQKLLRKAKIQPADVRAAGCHGQTIRHRPDLGFTIQLQNPALLAELTSIAVVADFRSRDIAAGGQGAPLVPAFHESVFRDTKHDRAIVNIGGISNITLLLRGESALGFDCGPGNMLMDIWSSRGLGCRFDAGGKWAASGDVIAPLLEAMLDERYFAQSPPKSTGRDLFDVKWLEQKLDPNYRAQDVQATLLELTARVIANDIARHAPRCAAVFLCGGGAQNNALVGRLGGLLRGVEVRKTDQLGIPAQQVEAVAFAWLAQQSIDGRAVDLTRVTGARHPAILGAIYPA